MPLKWAQEHYWNVSSSVVSPTGGAAGAGGYPLWQASVISVGFGGVQPWYERLRAWVRRMRTAFGLAQTIAQLDAEPRLVVERTLRAIQSPAYQAAREAVRETSKTLGFANREAWVPYSRMLKANPGRAENVFRHVRACELTRERLSSTLTNPEVNLAVELAYCGFAVKGQYFDGR